MIYELLAVGEENAVNAKTLQSILGLAHRDITEQIERERREGQPICATSSSKNAGYYLAGDSETLIKYCKRLEHREQEIAKTRRALIELETTLPTDQNTEDAAEEAEQ